MPRANQHFRLKLPLFLMLVCSINAFGQLTLRGVVVDSASMVVLPHVNVTGKYTGIGVASDIRGAFELNVKQDDSIVFSRVGYHTKVLPASVVKDVVFVFLREERRMLGEIEIRDRRPVWLPDLPAESVWKNETMNKSLLDRPGFQGVQTFGPGYVFRMPGSGFKKEALARKKLQEVREENYKAKDYIHLVNGPDIKGKMMKDYSLTEERFYELLARFNERNREFLFHLETHEVVPLLLQFFADECGKAPDTPERN